MRKNWFGLRTRTKSQQIEQWVRPMSFCIEFLGVLFDCSQFSMRFFIFSDKISIKIALFRGVRSGKWSQYKIKVKYNTWMVTELLINCKNHSLINRYSSASFQIGFVNFKYDSWIGASSDYIGLRTMTHPIWNFLIFSRMIL